MVVRNKKGWSVFTALLVFGAIWFWGWMLLHLGAWTFLFGDNMPRWYVNITPWVAAGIGMMYASLIVYRSFSERARPGYLRIHSTLALMLLVLAAAIQVFSWTDRIDGVTPKSAAENYIEKGKLASDIKYYFIEVSQDRLHNQQYVSYIVAGSDDRTHGKINVTRYGWFWWSVSSARVGMGIANKELNLAKELVTDPRQQDRGLHMMREIIKNYPGTSEANEAKRIVGEMDL